MMTETTTDSPVWAAVQLARTEAFSARIGRGLDAPGPPAGIIAVEHAAALWQAVLAKCNELAPQAQGHSAGAYGSDGRSCSVLVTRGFQEGYDLAWFVTAHAPPEHNRRRGITVQVQGPMTDNHDAHWERLLREDHDHVVCNHRWYSFGSGGNGGFGGQVFRWRSLADGQVRTWADMWSAGTIPPAWRERIPDTHEMLEGFEPTWMPS